MQRIAVLSDVRQCRMRIVAGLDPSLCLDGFPLALYLLRPKCGDITCAASVNGSTSIETSEVPMREGSLPI